MLNRRFVFLLLMSCSNTNDRPPAPHGLEPLAATSASLLWVPDEQHAFERARAERKGVMIEFYATWCVPCDELGLLLRAGPVASAIRPSFVPLRIDVSNDD